VFWTSEDCRVAEIARTTPRKVSGFRNPKDFKTYEAANLTTVARSDQPPV